MQPEWLRPVGPGLVDGPLQEPSAKPLTDEIGHQAELGQLDLIRLAAIQLGKSSRRAIDVQDVQLISWVADDGGKGLIRQFPATQPMEAFAHGVVERAVMRHGRRPDVKNRQPISWWRYGTVLRGEHFQV